MLVSAAARWERGLNENTNGLIRDFFPKGTDFSTIANAEVAKVERLLNARPRKSLASVHRKRFSTRPFTHKVLCAGNLNPRIHFTFPRAGNWRA